MRRPRHRSGPRRLGRFAAVLVVACLAVACVASPATEVVVDRRAFPSSADEIPSAACAALDPIVARRIYNGIDPVRSGEIQLIPPENLQAGGLSHASPFDTTQRVPLLIHGPGVVPGTYDAPATLADLAPTAARILRFPGFRAPDGRPLMQALQPDSRRPVPRLVVTVIWDSAGLDLLASRRFLAIEPWQTWSHIARDLGPGTARDQERTKMNEGP